MSGSPVRISSARQINYSEGISDNLIPDFGYQRNLGSPFKKWLGVYAAELNVETLVAQDTIATIGGRLLVGPTTSLTADLSPSVNLIANPSFETSGSGGGDVFASWSEVFNGSTIARSTDFAPHSGTYSCKLTTSASAPYVQQSFTVVPGEAYSMSVWTKGTGVSTGNWGVWDVTHSANIFRISTGISGGSWTEIFANFIIPAGCTSIFPFFYGSDTPGDIIYYDDAAMYQSNIYVKHNEMSGSDIVYMEGDGNIEFMQVISASASGSGPYLYTVRRNLDGTVENTWYAGDAIFNTGKYGDGFIDLYSQHGIKYAYEYGPSIVGNVRNSLTYNDWIPRWGIGNLNGLYDYSGTAWGAVFGGYGSGSANITIDNINGIRLRNYNNTVIHFDNSGSALITGDLYISASGIIYAGGGNVRIDANGIKITDVVTSVREIQWYYNGGSGLKFVGGILGDYGGGESSAVWVRSLRTSSSPWATTEVTLQAWDTQHSRDARVNLSASGSATKLEMTTLDIIRIGDNLTQGVNIADTIAINNTTSNIILNMNAGSIIGSTAIASRVYRTTDQPIANSSNTQIVFDAARFSHDNMPYNIESGSTTTLYCFTDGTYFITGNVRWEANTVGHRALSILINSASLIAAQQYPVSSSSAVPISMNVSTIWYLNSGDYATLNVYQNSGGNLNVTSTNYWSPEFSMVRIA